MKNWDHIVPDHLDPDWQCPFCLKRSCRKDCGHWYDNTFEAAKPSSAKPLRIDKDGVRWLEERRKHERGKEGTEDTV